jgi:serine-type D-Ala-D-Ala carboxypeptidase (penicillin-binding protein 5/6)
VERRALRAVAVALALLVGSLIALPLALAAKHPDPDVPPPTPVLGPGGRMSPSPFPTVLRTPPPSASTPEIAAGSAALVDLDTGQVLLAQDADAERPIASLTKLMTAVLVLRRADPADVVTVSERASTAVGGVGISELGLRTGERLSVEQLLYALLLQSANDAAVALAEHVSGSVDAFVRAMNAEARRLGMRHTRFYSPNGLDDRGYSTALDLARLTRAAYAEPLFERIDTTRFHEIASPSGPPREIQNRNVLLWLYKGAIGGKTGFTTAAGFCVVAVAQREGIRLAAVVLDAPGEPFSAAAELLSFGFAAFDRKRLVERGEPFDAVDVQGRDVPVAAARPLDALVRADARIRYVVVPRTGSAYPPSIGEAVATLRVEAGSTVLRRMPLVVTRVPPPPAIEDAGPWWRRAGNAVAGALSSALAALFG